VNSITLEAAASANPGVFSLVASRKMFSANAGGERRALDQPRHMLVGQPVWTGLLAAARNPPEQRSMGDTAELQPGLQGDDGAGGLAGAGANLDLAPSGLFIDDDLIATAIHDVYRDGAEAALRHVERAIEWHAVFEAHRRTLVEQRQAEFVTDEQQRLRVEFPEDRFDGVGVVTRSS
jgi:hypothetical protein